MKNLKHGFLLGLTACYMVACSSAPEGEQVEVKEEQKIEAVAQEAKVLQVSTDASNIDWLGTKPGGEHKGVMKLKDGELRMMDDQLIGGKFTLDMTSIEVTDLEGEKKEQLEGHLKTGDFFEVEKYPTAVFEISKIEAVEGKEDVTHNITGNLTMRDITKSVTLPAKVTYEGGKLMAQTPKFTIDRTEWGIEYKSSKLGEMAINDNMGIELKLVAN